MGSFHQGRVKNLFLIIIMKERYFAFSIKEKLKKQFHKLHFFDLSQVFISFFFPSGDLSSGDAKVSSSIGFSEELKSGGGTKKQKKQKQRQKNGTNDDKICGKYFFSQSCFKN